MDLQAEIIRKYNSGLALNYIVHYVQYSGAKKSTLKQARDTVERCIVAYLLRQKHSNNGVKPITHTLI